MRTKMSIQQTRLAYEAPRIRSAETYECLALACTGSAPGAGRPPSPPANEICVTNKFPAQGSDPSGCTACNGS